MKGLRIGPALIAAGWEIRHISFSCDDKNTHFLHDVIYTIADGKVGKSTLTAVGVIMGTVIMLLVGFVVVLLLVVARQNDFCKRNGKSSCSQ